MMLGADALIGEASYIDRTLKYTENPSGTSILGRKSYRRPGAWNEVRKPGSNPSKVSIFQQGLEKMRGKPLSCFQKPGIPESVTPGKVC